MTHKIVNPIVRVRLEGAFDPEDLQEEILFKADQVLVRRGNLLVAETIKDNIADFGDVNVAGIADESTLQWDTAAGEFQIVNVGRPFARAMTQDSPAVTNHTSEQDMTATPQIAIPAGTVESAGTILRVAAAGIIGNTASAAVTIRLSFSTQTIFTMVPFDCGGAGRFWRIEWDLIYYGATNMSVNHKVGWFGVTGKTDMNIVGRAIVPFNPEGNDELVMSAQWDTANPSNTITMQQLTLEVLNANAN